MSGHSKWSTIKRQKGVADAKRGMAFTKVANAITVAVREGGANPESNFKLKLAIEAAKTINMPKDNIERAIDRVKGAGRNENLLEEITYEGYGPAGVAIIVEAATDNRLRTAQEVRSIFERNGGTLSGQGSVSHLFSPVGEVTISFKEDLDPDQILLKAADAGADDVETDINEAAVYCKATELEKVKKGLSSAGLEIVEAKLSRKPVSTVKIEDEKKAESVLSLVNKLDDLVDVQKVYANFDISEDLIDRNAKIMK